MSSLRTGGPSWGSDEQSSSDPNSSSDTFQSGTPLNVQAMIEERRKSRSRPRQALQALRSSLIRQGTDGSSFDDDVGCKTGRKSLFRRASKEGSIGGSESVGSGSDIGGGLGGDSQVTHRRRDTKTTFKLPNFLSQASPASSNDDTDHHRQFSKDNRGNEIEESRYAKTIRRYGAGQYVLISNHNLDEGSSCLVNRYGFPEGGGGALYSEQRRGPYIYLLAQVKNVHFGEDAQYYTVSRCDNGKDQRADGGWMEPITDPLGIEAAKIAAKKLCNGTASTHVQNHSDSVFLSSMAKGTKRCIHGMCTGMSLLQKKMKEQATKCLNGNRPYKISFKFTGVNFLVLCSIWYLYIDQMRLAFFPHSADFACAIVSCAVWFILVAELIMEVFIRPSEWRALIRSEKAFLPSTCRYLSTFHLIAEMISLILFIPEFMCVFGDGNCGAERTGHTLGELVTKALFGPTKLKAFYGNAYLCTLRLRIFGLVRHWTKMWLNSTFVLEKGKAGEWHIKRGKGLLIPQGKHIRPRGEAYAIGESGLTDSLSMEKSTVSGIKESHDVKDQKYATSDDYHLTNASKIGTALFMTNARRALIWMFLIGLMPLIVVACTTLGGINTVWKNSVEMLQANNIAVNDTTADSCEFLRQTVEDWIASVGFVQSQNGLKPHLLHFTLEPVRCDTLNKTNICLLLCEPHSKVLECDALCNTWTESAEERFKWYEYEFDVRPNDIVAEHSEVKSMWYSLPNGTVVEADFFVNAQFNESVSVKETNIKIYTLQLLITIIILFWLSILRFDAGRFVLGPLRRMLKIVAWYAKNPLLPLPKRERSFDSSAGMKRSSSSIFRRQSIMSQNEIYYESDDDEAIQQLGNFETDALVNTVTTITDLMRRCWGVAGANIISANLARQEGGLASSFNPTVPGEAAYALFAFIGIKDFDNHLNALKDEIMILINDIAAVLHEEVYRWGYEDSGQCNKNLGGAFLMVYKIGAVKEVIEKLEQAEAVIFSRRTTKVRRRRSRRSILSTNRISTNSTLTRAPADRMSGNHLDSIDLSSLPGMRAFTDRALLGLLKTFVGIHRDKTILEWNDDFRLGAGVGAASINLLFGMDAGWAVEGAVGSEYKIDATYLSPHVNMASRMMSATKQYGVHFLLSERVQKLLSENAKGTLRHLDTVTVKGSSVPLKIFTYDAKVRHDFFLYSRTESQADLDSERYSTSIWHTDQDLCAMRSHVSDEFIATFTRGREEYLAGNWPQAIELLLQADNLMFEAQLEEGYNTSLAESSFRNINIADDREVSQERLALGDGPCQNLIVYMKSRGGVAPKNWDGYRALTSK